MKILASALLIPSLVLANEANLSCDLERARAEVSASTLAAPQAFGSLGQDPITTSKSAIAGVSQSFSGRLQASRVRQAAEARCDALRATLLLEEHGRWATSTVQHAGAIAELHLIEEAIRLAQANISQLDAQLTAQIITISQHTAARQQLVSLEQRQSELLRTLATVVLPTPAQDITALIATAQAADATAARLVAEASANTGWDITAQAGVRQPIGGGSTTTFGNIALRYSFGYADAKAAAQQVGELTSALSAIQQSGFAQTVDRQKKELQSLADAETLAIATSARQLTHLRHVRSTITGIETALALNTLRDLDLQLLVLQAEEAGAQARLNGYRDLFDQLK